MPLMLPLYEVKRLPKTTMQNDRSQPEWKAMVAKGVGMTADATVVLLACAIHRGFEVRAEKKGEPLKALNDAAKAETDAARKR